MGKVAGLGEDKDLQDLDPLLESLQPLCPPGLKGPLHIGEGAVPGKQNSEEKTEEMVKPRTFTEDEARVHWWPGGRPRSQVR